MAGVGGGWGARGTDGRAVVVDEVVGEHDALISQRGQVAVERGQLGAVKVVPAIVVCRSRQQPAGVSGTVSGAGPEGSRSWHTLQHEEDVGALEGGRFGAG